MADNSVLTGSPCPFLGRFQAWRALGRHAARNRPRDRRDAGEQASPLARSESNCILGCRLDSTCRAARPRGSAVDDQLSSGRDWSKSKPGSTAQGRSSADFSRSNSADPLFGLPSGGAGRGAAGVTNARSRARASVETGPNSINSGRRTGEAGGLTTPAPRSRRSSRLTAVKQSLNATSPSERSKTQKNGGGGGNRTHVRIASSGRVYVCSLRLISEMPGAMTSQAFPSST